MSTKKVNPNYVPVSGTIPDKVFSNLASKPMTYEELRENMGTTDRGRAVLSASLNALASKGLLVRLDPKTNQPVSKKHVLGARWSLLPAVRERYLSVKPGKPLVASKKKKRAKPSAKRTSASLKKTAKEAPSAWEYRNLGIDGIWTPSVDVGSHLSGVLMKSVRVSDKTYLVFELLEPCKDVINVGLPGDKGVRIVAPLHSLVAVPEWPQLEELWETRAGYKVNIDRGMARNIGRGRRMFDVKVSTSTAPYKKEAAAPSPLPPSSVPVTPAYYQMALKADAEARAHAEKPKSMSQVVFDEIMTARSKALKEIGAIDQFLTHWPN